MDLQDVFYQLENSLYLYEKELVLGAIFLLTFIFVFTSIKKSLFKENSERGVAAITSLVVSALATFYLSRTQIATILNSYNVLGFLITFLIPFGLILGFIHSAGLISSLRKWMLAIFGVIFFYVSSQQQLLDETPLFIAVGFIIFTIIFDRSLHESFTRPRQRVRRGSRDY